MRSASLVLAGVVVTMVIAGCAGGDGGAADSPNASAVGSVSAAGGTAGDTTGGRAPANLAGTWTLRSVPETGDTTVVSSTLVATGDTSGWRLTLENRPAIPVRVTFMGDSIQTVSGPYESVLRPGVQVTTTSIFRMQGDSLVGRTTARYAGGRAGADSVLRLRVTGRRAR